jgi:hypothetical protein
MAKIGFIGAGKDHAALKAAGADTFYIGTWTGFQKRLQPGDTAMVTRAGHITRSPRRFAAITTELAKAGIGLVILDHTEGSG